MLNEHYSMLLLPYFLPGVVLPHMCAAGLNLMVDRFPLKFNNNAGLLKLQLKCQML